MRGTRLAPWVLALAVLVLGLLGAIPRAAAHEMRPSLLELIAHDDGRVDVRWSVATVRGAPLALTALLPGDCEAGVRTEERTPTVLTQRWTARCPAAGLDAFTVEVTGLERSGTDVVVRVQPVEGSARTTILRAGSSRWTINARGGGAGEESEEARVGAWGYLEFGVGHIAGGFDHLLFVTGLLLVVSLRRGVGPLLAAITAFTVAHSVTLGLTVLGYTSAPSAAVEAIIALSIVILAVEVARDPGDSPTPTWTQRHPWAVAFVCGLVHGFGFAGALAELGLPRDEIPLALVMFNLGVELGQLAFIAALVLLSYVASMVARGRFACTRWRRVVAYGIGAVSAYWLIERLVAMVETRLA